MGMGLKYGVGGGVWGCVVGGVVIFEMEILYGICGVWGIV